MIDLVKGLLVVEVDYINLIPFTYRPQNPVEMLNQLCQTAAVSPKPMLRFVQDTTSLEVSDKPCTHHSLKTFNDSKNWSQY